MDSNPFFKWVWRLNGILLLIAVLVVTASIGYEAIRAFTQNPQESAVVTNVADDPSGTEKWVLGGMQDLPGTELAMISLVSENDQVAMKRSGYLGSGGRYWDPRSGPAKNILFLDKVSNRSYWLFPDNQQIIYSSAPFPPVRYGEQKERATKAIFYEFITVDSNTDGVMNEADKVSLAISHPDGTGLSVIAPQFDHVIGKNLTGDNQAIVVYQIDGIAHSTLVDLASLKITHTTELPRVKDPD
ncbi:hypothetical protein [Thiosocius teredinicola]|uniref:hypothetical protein n=1 Tax=Thiosocius teredinicola TaxID=1973002 RepID=UPI000F76E934